MHSDDDLGDAAYLGQMLPGGSGLERPGGCSPWPDSGSAPPCYQVVVKDWCQRLLQGPVVKDGPTEDAGGQTGAGRIARTKRDLACGEGG